MFENELNRKATEGVWAREVISRRYRKVGDAVDGSGEPRNRDLQRKEPLYRHNGKARIARVSREWEGREAGDRVIVDSEEPRERWWLQKPLPDVGKGEEAC
jgi:hypothetical protein